MIYDCRTLGATDLLTADVCIIGGGAAGIAIAREFISSPLKVLLLESGGFRRETRLQNLYQAESTGEHYYLPLESCRSRFFGGSTNCWGGICTPLDPIDFEERPWISWSGWPLSPLELEPYFRRAHRLCSTGPFAYGAEAWLQTGLNPHQFDPALFRPFVWHFNSRDEYDLSFGRRFRSELRRSSNVDVLLNANVTELITSGSGSVVERARVRTLEGHTREVRAKRFILACGGIENPRILLASTGCSPCGVGNENGLVGRFFHEHLQLPCGLLAAPHGASEAARYSRLYALGGTACLPGFGLSPAAQREWRVPNVSLSIDPLYDREGAFIALQTLRSDWRARRLSEGTLKHLWKVASDCGEWAPEVWRRFVRGDRPQGDRRQFIVFARSEQTPNHDSRVTLSPETDELGMPRAVLDWHTTPADRRGIRLAASYAFREFRRLNIGEVIAADWLAGEDWPVDLAGGPHHMGTTRMSANPRAGVVDQNCKVHGVDQLYVAGSSVFPTGGHANPTLSILALALRLADHIRESLGRSTTSRVPASVESHVMAGTEK